jgi:preprotein translocase subunit SecG
MTTLFVVLITIVSLLLILVIMVQNPKGGGLSSAFGGGGTQMLGGVQKSTDLLDRTTWILTIALLVLVLGVNMLNTPEAADVTEQSTITEQAGDLAPQQGAPAQMEQNEMQMGGEMPANVEEGQ